MSARRDRPVDFGGSVVLVTGATGGLGPPSATRLRERARRWRQLY